MSARLPLLPPAVPRWQGRWLLRALGKLVVILSGWRVTGEFPNLPKLVAIAAPHSSLWDGIFGLSAGCALNLRPTWMGKDALFRGPFGALMRTFGGVATDRSNPKGLVGQTVAEFQKREQLWLLLAPEGTRREVAKWRTGFYHIAVGAGVPILPVYFHYPEKRIGLLPVFYPSGNLEADLQALQQMYAPWRGKDGKSALPSEGRAQQGQE